MSSLFNMLLSEYWLLLKTLFLIWLVLKLHFQMFALAASAQADEKVLEGHVILTKNWIIIHINQVPPVPYNYHISVSNCCYFQVWMRLAINHCSCTLKDMAALPFDAVCASLEAWWMLVHSLAQAEAQRRNYSSHFSSFLCFPGWPLTLSFYLINGTVSLVAVVIKSNEVWNGWGFVESAVGNWGGGCVRWGSLSVLCPYDNEIVFHFSLRQS